MSKKIGRRRFLRQAAATVAGLGLTASGFPAIRIPGRKEKLGVALVGLGYYSTDLLAPALQLTQHCYLAGIVTGTPAKAERWKQRYGIPDRNIYNYQNFNSLASNPEIDIVYVVLPPSLHSEYSIRAAQAGKHVWCEKPMAMTTAECQKMIQACSANNVKLSIGYRMHHEPNTKRIIQFRKDLTYGAITRVEAAAGYFDPRTDHWKQKKSMGGGVMYDMGVYPLNAARYCTGSEPVAVTALASTTRPAIYREVEETITFELDFPHGATASCEASFGRGMNDLKVTCSKGGYSLSPFQAYNGIDGVTSDGLRLNTPIGNEQATQMDDDALAIMTNAPVLVPGEEGLRDIAVVEAIYRSVAAKTKVAIR
jgi:glucose-fructose oxidoreductase